MPTKKKKTAASKKAISSKKTKRTSKKAQRKTKSARTSTSQDIDMTPPKAVQKALERGLELRKDYGGKGLVPTTIAWARKLAKGQPITPAKARKMHAYFARHKVDKKPGWHKPPTPGYVAWLLWGGDAAVTWSAKLTKMLDDE